MYNFSDIYNTQTLKLLDDLRQGEYDDPFALRKYLENSDRVLTSFSQELWATALMRYPCANFAKLCADCDAALTSGRDAGQAAAKRFEGKKQEDWLRFYSRRPIQTRADIVPVVSAYLRETCLSSPLCRPCDCKKRLVDFFTETSGGMNYESAKRNVNNWLSGASKPADRRTYIALCYALGLRILPGTAAPISADRFLSFVCDQNPLHVRDAEEAVHYFCLRRPMGQALSPGDDYDTAGNYRYAADLLDRIKEAGQGGSSVGSERYTIQSRQYLDGVEKEEELVAHLSRAPKEEHRYHTASIILKRFCREYEEYLENETQFADLDLGEAYREEWSKKKPLTKQAAADMIHLLIELEPEQLKAAGAGEFARQHSLSDALYRSEIVGQMAGGELPMERAVVVLTALTLNYGIIYDAGRKRMRQTKELSNIPTFNHFCRTLSDMLEHCTMAPLYPKRRLDFLVLYAYLRMTKDVNKHQTVGALSDYLAMAVQSMAEDR